MIAGQQTQEYCFYSGGADGADTYWTNSLIYRGQRVVVYRPYHIDALSPEESDIVETAYQEVVKRIGRRPMDKSRYAGKLVRRDMLQERDCTSLYAIGTLGSNGLINGGTAYASTRAILNHKNVYLYEQNREKWMFWSYSDEKFVDCAQPPILDYRSTVVGTREINQSGKLAIDDIIARTFHNGELLR